VTVVLFCGGQGIRLQASLPGVPKPLVPIGGEPILAHLMRWYAHHGHREFVVCLGHNGHRIADYFLQELDPIAVESLPGGLRRVRIRRDQDGEWTVTIVPTGLQASIGERLRAVRGHLDEATFLANYADGLSDLDLPTFLARFQASGALGGLITVRPPSTHHLVRTDHRGLVEMVRSATECGLRVNGGFFVFRPEIFEWLAPGEDLAEGLFPRLVSERQLFAYAHDGFWACMDTPKDWLALQELEAAEKTPWKVWRRTAADPFAPAEPPPRLAPSDLGA
jgi:glucose-1-phosphate cytidylyltransferase